MIQFPKPFILASNSPRRAELLKKIGINFKIVSSSVDENIKIISPSKFVKELAFLKANSVTKSIKNGTIFGADTIVVIDGKILGKPTNSIDSKKMLRRLSGREHYVYTGICFIDMPSMKFVTEYAKTKVKFKILSSNEINRYVESNIPLDKAGAYGIQDEFGSIFVESITGCFYNVVGLPLNLFYQTAIKFNSRL